LFVCCVEISQIMAILVAILVMLESPQWIVVYWVGFMMFQPMMQKLLNIEQFSH
jgi:hypothetical protein